MRRSRAIVIAALPLAASGCFQAYDLFSQATLGYRSPVGIRVDRTRYGSSVTPEAFRDLEVGRSSLKDALEMLGAPARFRRTETEETLEYYYKFSRATRLVFRPIFFLPYGGNASYRYDGSEQGPDAVVLTFDHEGRLLRKAFRHSLPEDTFEGTVERVFVP